MNFDFLFKPVEELDAWLTGSPRRRPAARRSGIAFLLGLRHASDPDHLVAVTSLVAADDGDTRRAARLGAWWGPGTPARCVLIGLPLIAFKSELPAWLETGAEKAVGLVILLLAARVFGKWARGDYRASAHSHDEATARSRRHLRRGPAQHTDTCRSARAEQAVSIGSSARPRRHRRRRPAADRGAADPARGGAALGVFAPMSILSMALCTSAFAWVLTRPSSSRSTARADPGARTVRRDVRALVRGAGVSAEVGRTRGAAGALRVVVRPPSVSGSC